MNKSQPLLQAKGICKSFQTTVVIDILSDLEMSINSAEMIAIVGASGSGKTTLLNILGTLERPDAGSIYFVGEDILAKGDHALCRFRNKSIGFMFQFHHLLPEFDALENVIMPGIIAGLDRKELQQSAHELLDKMGLANRIKHKVGELSGGEQQRVSLARALILKPALLLADEPTGNLDPQAGFKVFDLMAEMSEQFSVSTVMVTHNYDLAKRMNRCLTLTGGRLEG
ncbi:MAG: ABC transporter ATP-binding protein [Desulfobulbaceae bacterium]|nr:ABC transporter ATP-binding protein [Desulfobulbaceae bacterium]